ncbi:helix-turn-helix domain-containing protein [Chryseobacterium sp. SIMBA_028]|uniref:helix-turn-helix domain-containing protein n=1 Tax=Chryseobacterium sp. SIMBA_028 TaxID=3085771 RepID=UPI00397E60B0
MLDITNHLSKRGWTQTELSERMGISKSTLSDNLKNPTLAKLNSIADAFGIPVRDLFPAEVEEKGEELFIKDENGKFKSIGFLNRNL